MFEKVNPSHVDKIADRIAGAVVDLAYAREENPRIAVEVQIGHGFCRVTAETSVQLKEQDVFDAVTRIAGDNYDIDYIEAKQNIHLAENQRHGIRCGDNGIFRGMPVTEEQRWLTDTAKKLYEKFPYDGKYILDEKTGKLIICQSNVPTELLKDLYPSAIVNPLGDWTGGTSVDTGATNRKLGSDMGDSVTGGGLFGKDSSKADVTLNIYAWLRAQETGKPVELSCAIGDEFVDGIPYADIVKLAREFIGSKGGFERFAEWGLID